MYRRRLKSLDERLFALYMAAGDLSTARKHAKTAEDLRALGQAQASRSQMEAVAGKTTGGDPQSILNAAAAKVHAGPLDAGLEMMRQLLNKDPASAMDIVRLAWDFARSSPETGLGIMELTTAASVREGDWTSAAAGLQEFVRRIPNYVPAILRLVEVCMDGGLEGTLFGAQAQLADAYLAHGAGTEARVVAEDLIARQPSEAAHAERLRRALALLGEPEEPSSDDMLVDELPEYDSRLPPPDPEPFGERSRAGDWPMSLFPSRDEADLFRASHSSLRDDADLDDFADLELSAGAFDLESMLTDIEHHSAAPVSPALPSTSEDVEIELSMLLDDFSAEAPAQEEQLVEPIGPEPGGLEDVSEEFHSSSSVSEQRAAEQDYQRGVSLHAAGRIEESIRAFEMA